MHATAHEVRQCVSCTAMSVTKHSVRGNLQRGLYYARILCCVKSEVDQFWKNSKSKKLFQQPNLDDHILSTISVD